jgi:hypothetical protein
LTLTPIVPVDALEGTVTTSWVDVAEFTVAATPLKVTALLAGVVLKLVPVIVTDVPAAPLVGVKPVIVGGGMTVKLLPLVTLLPLTMTVIAPVVAPLGTFATKCVVVADVIVAVVPLNLTVSFEMVAL